MNNTILQNAMKKNNWNDVDVAHFLKLHPSTVRRYLNGESVHRSTEFAFEQLVIYGPPQSDPEPPSAA